MEPFDRRRVLRIWLPIIGGPALALGVFLVTYWMDSSPETKGLAGFFLSVIVLIISQWLVTYSELKETSDHSKQLYDAIKAYLHVTPVGSPEEALRYVSARLGALREVQNTRLNIDEEAERAEEKLYESSAFNELLDAIPLYCKGNLIWKDIGDARALAGLRQLHGSCIKTSTGKVIHYKYKLLSHVEPQINFILLEYWDGAKEVLFNWDFRSAGQDPTVLVSRDHRIIDMFTIQFNMLWRRASADHDNQATKSTSMK